ncbi:MAG: hypothetical protein Q4G18_03580 [Myroides sp.]|nr:hypothetical protein [Myroides sp.]
MITEVTIRIDIFYKTNYAKLFAWRFGLLLIAQARCLRQRGGTILRTTFYTLLLLLTTEVTIRIDYLINQNAKLLAWRFTFTTNY